MAFRKKNKGKSVKVANQKGHSNSKNAKSRGKSGQSIGNKQTRKSPYKARRDGNKQGGSVPDSDKSNGSTSSNSKKWSTKKPPMGKRKVKEESDSEFEEVKESRVEEVGFPSKNAESVDSDESDHEQKDTRELVRKQNRKHKKSGGFQSMGLSFNVLKGILRKGYKIPTPIQRKTIPLILDGKDIVAMARTGSGKTAAFLVPMFERLKTHLTSGARALILSPTRELALQTLKFAKEIGKYTGLKSAVILGGDRMEDQFSALHESPDILIATPGRFMHIMIEMDLKLKNVEYIVFDEADRLFEMGFAEQLHEVLQRIPETRQTLLFSATLPKLLVEFAKAGLHDPTLIRLDVDSKISEYLKMSFLECRADDKPAVLLHLLRNVVKTSEQTVIFVATKHHVEYLNMVLTEAGISCSCSYSALDQTARKINVAKFRAKKTMVLLVTDLAARGIDIPMLDNVINYHFPAKPKLFVHRVGRVARAGRSGTSYSLVSIDELPFVQDLHLFLGRPVKCVVPAKTKRDEDGLLGRVPQSVIDNEEDDLRQWHSKTDLQSMMKVIHNAFGHYCRTRPSPSSESVKRMKELASLSIGVHPIFEVGDEEMELAKAELLDSMRNYKPHNTIFEVNSTVKSQAFDIMKKKRAYHGRVIVKANDVNKEKLARFFSDNTTQQTKVGQEVSTDSDLLEVFGENAVKRKKKDQIRDDDNFIAYKPKDYNTEKGLEITTSFQQEATNASLDMAGDDNSERKQISNQMKWDRKRKKFVRSSGQEPGGSKRVKTESGAWVKASYKTNIYNDWLEKNKVAEQDNGSEDEDTGGSKGQGSRHRKSARFQSGGGKGRGKFRGSAGKDRSVGAKSKPQGNSRELKRKEEVLKERRKKNKLAAFQKHHTEKKKRKGPRQK